ncbi:hypothetical protein EXIGLDRAFT_773485 [Exidia glandulosa HHB12029]|uniref:Uncharacterized protein n=1 Tax=Exidia glandulosa HHB12029 TaxID=1314781 RepID=A0A165ET70_EXIGL|nr:hypothetical protein EXIGLDRAFT_773485 [Exidia glandulosa HHB12029]
MERHLRRVHDAQGAQLQEHEALWKITNEERKAMLKVLKEKPKAKRKTRKPVKRKLTLALAYRSCMVGRSGDSGSADDAHAHTRKRRRLALDGLAAADEALPNNALDSTVPPSDSESTSDSESDAVESDESETDTVDEGGWEDMDEDKEDGGLDLSSTLDGDVDMGDEPSAAESAVPPPPPPPAPPSNAVPPPIITGHGERPRRTTRTTVLPAHDRICFCEQPPRGDEISFIESAFYDQANRFLDAGRAEDALGS